MLKYSEIIQEGEEEINMLLYLELWYGPDYWNP